MPGGRSLRGLVLAALIVASAGPVLASRTDVVTVENGDSLTGEIKQCLRGTLRFKTDATDTINIEWDRVLRLTSADSFQVENTEGVRYLGSLIRSSGDRLLRVATSGGEIELPLKEVVRIFPIKGSWLKRLDGGISAGLNYTKSSDVKQITLSGNVTSRSVKSKKDLAFTSIVTDQETGTSQRDDLTGTFQRFLRRRYFASGSLALQRNDELGIDLRTLLTGGAGRYFVQTTHSELAFGLGLAYNREQFIGDEHADENLEGVLGFSFDVFKDSPRDVAVQVALQFYPGITQSGRNRTEFDSRVRYEIVKDFVFEVTLYASRDTDPPAEANKSDYGIVTALGWTF